MTTVEGFESFATDNYARVVATLTLYCRDRDVAEELAHDALVRARERWEEVSGMAAPGAWPYRVAVNLANSRFRRRLAESRAMARVRARQGTPGDPDTEVAVLVRGAVAGLPSRQREAVILRYFADMSVADAAQLMGITPGSMKQLTHRAISSLRSHPDIGELIRQEVGDGV